jgi:hypothetical protein
VVSDWNRNNEYDMYRPRFVARVELEGIHSKTKRVLTEICLKPSSYTEREPSKALFSTRPVLASNLSFITIPGANLDTISNVCWSLIRFGMRCDAVIWGRFLIDDIMQAPSREMTSRRNVRAFALASRDVLELTVRWLIFDKAPFRRGTYS